MPVMTGSYINCMLTLLKWKCKGFGSGGGGGNAAMAVVPVYDQINNRG